MKNSSDTARRVIFRNLAHVSGKTDRIFIHKKCYELRYISGQGSPH